MGVPGWPDLACWTASIESVRIVLIDKRSNSSQVMGNTFRVRCRTCFQGRNFAQPAKVPLGLAIFGCQKSLDKIPCHGGTDRPASHAKDVHVVVLDPLLGREVIVNQ